MFKLELNPSFHISRISELFFKKRSSKLRTKLEEFQEPTHDDIVCFSSLNGL